MQQDIFPIDFNNASLLVDEWDSECEHDFPHHIQRDDIHLAIQKIIESAPVDSNDDPWGANQTKFEILGLVHSDTMLDFFTINNIIMSEQYPNKAIVYPNELGAVSNMRIIINNTSPQVTRLSLKGKPVFTLYAFPRYYDGTNPHIMIKIYYTKMLLK